MSEKGEAIKKYSGLLQKSRRDVKCSRRSVVSVPVTVCGVSRVWDLSERSFSKLRDVWSPGCAPETQTIMGVN